MISGNRSSPEKPSIRRLNTAGVMTCPSAKLCSKLSRNSFKLTSFSRLGGSWMRYITGDFFASSAFAAATLAAIM